VKCEVTNPIHFLRIVLASFADKTPSGTMGHIETPPEFQARNQAYEEFHNSKV
jgi:hypothetical protein